VIDVWSRLWPSIMVGKRSYRNTFYLLRDLSRRMSLETIPLITTDGFKFYERVIGRAFGPACVYGQVIKTRRNDRVVRVERRAVIGAGRLEQALRNSEDSAKLNTSFVERLNLTIRQGSSYLGRRTICQARWKQCLEDHIELFRCYYNFIRPHRALKFGRELRNMLIETVWTVSLRTPAARPCMQLFRNDDFEIVLLSRHSDFDLILVTPHDDICGSICNRNTADLNERQKVRKHWIGETDPFLGSAAY
jgi:IS1 family transposase